MNLAYSFFPYYSSSYLAQVLEKDADDYFLVCFSTWYTQLTLISFYSAVSLYAYTVLLASLFLYFLQERKNSKNSGTSVSS